MKRLLMSLSLALLGAALIAPDAEAKRLGGGGSSGLQRSMPARTTPQAAPGQPAPNQAAPAPATPSPMPAAAPATPKRSWLGPVAGLAAGLGLAALASHLGFGAEFANVLMIALLAVVAFVVLRLVLRRFAPAAPQRGLQYAGAGAPAPSPAPAPASVGSGGAPVLAPVEAAAPTLPADFDAAGFERVAKLIFIRLQAANDAGDLEDLRAFTTPEMFAAVKLDLQERQGAAQQTDVVRLDAAVLDFAREATRQVVSVRFHGLIREEKGGAAAPFDEIWHLVKPQDGSREWAIAGIQQNA